MRRGSNTSDVPFWDYLRMADKPGVDAMFVNTSPFTRTNLLFSNLCSDGNRICNKLLRLTTIFALDARHGCK